MSDASFRQVAKLAAELDLPVHVHLHETEDEIERSLAEHGVRPFERLQRLGLLGPGLIAVHAVHLEPAGDRAARHGHGCSVAHCPSSNLKLASGFAPIEALRRAGVNLCLGTDGAASNNRLDIFQEMRTAALLAKAVAGDAQAHARARRAARRDARRRAGARPRARVIGSIAPGKAADLVAVALRGPELAPCYDPVSHLVYAAGREHVTHVWVNGEARVVEGRLLPSRVFRFGKAWQLWQNALKSHADS